MDRSERNRPERTEPGSIRKVDTLMDKDEQKYLMSVWKTRHILDGERIDTRRKTKIHATQKGADYTYCGLGCAHWENRISSDGNDVDCNRCRKSIGRNGEL